VIDALFTDRRIRAARRHIERSDDETLARQAALSAIPAPTGAEGPRAARVAAMFREAGLADVAIDAVGNVRGWYGRSSPDEGPVLLAAHLDTVFGPELDVSVARRGTRLEGPGIADNARGLAALVAIAHALTEADVRTARAVLFAATVGEEGHGDLRGVRHLLGPSDRPAVRPSAFIALDGAGVERIVHRALGSRRYRAMYRGPGGHSWSAFGVGNPAHAVGRATADIADLPTSHTPRSTCCVVRIGGGTGLNCIPQEAWLDLDLRSEDPRVLAQLDERVQKILAGALEPGLTLEVQRLGERPSGVTPRSHPLVLAAVAATRAVGQSHRLACASTDANVPIALGVPAIALGAGGRAGDAHLPTEWYDNTGGALGIVRALLVAAQVAGVN
jgi:acetylornithine deacetylase/succinyl-diaminopimelate desuccinylase-like protein